MSFGVDAEAIIACGKTVDGLSQEAEKIKEAARAAIVPEISWGLLGQALTYSDYVELTDAFMDHMGKMTENLGKLGDQLSLTGEHYRDVNKAVADALDDIGRQLGQGSKPPSVGSGA
ncbi:hypothetical protein [Saccharothrix deserti]|uniref:hypothetical protein n=1 Tax=Saccharothrix deserti TaxID=2593674 RepID=UPI00131CB9C1|nr:hypothetical protein [Saccharothrix deserti]